MPSILPLTLKREFFDQILAGEKTIEYREQKPYWQVRLEGKFFDIVRFRNGYRPDSPEMDVQFLGLRKVQKWGTPYYAIKLGTILRKKRCGNR